MFNDIWLGKFTLDLIPISWTRGVFRFNGIKLVSETTFIAGDCVYDTNLRIVKKKEVLMDYCDENRYGCFVKTVETSATSGEEKCQVLFAHLTANCSIVFSE
jgi:hypothetical protein